MNTSEENTRWYFYLNFVRVVIFAILIEKLSERGLPMKEKEHYGLGTAISMIVGITIGSGIFFKVDDILAETGGRVWLGALVFVIGAFCVIFGSITLSQLASRVKNNKGVISYYEEFISSKVASAFGWFQLFVYFPTIGAVVSWVSGIYTLSLLGIPSSLELQTFIGFIYISFFYSLNYLSHKNGGRFQNITTIAKIIPLIGVALLGLFWQQSSTELSQGISVVEKSSVGFSWLAALAPIAFSFDGWIVSTNITQEVKNHKRNMPMALTMGPLLVLFLYLAFYFGMIAIVGTDYILAAGDQAIIQIGYLIFGQMGEKILLLFILLAVLGVVNGLSLGYIRLPQILASKKMLPYSDKIVEVNPEKGLSPHAAMLAYFVTVFWLIIHYVSQRLNLLRGGDVSEIAVVFSYLAYILLYTKVIQLKKKGVITSNFLGIIAPSLGILGSLIILVGGLFSNPLYGPIFLVFSGLISVLGYCYFAINNK